MLEKADEFRIKLDDLATKANEVNVKECLRLIEEKMLERARSGKYDMKMSVVREYLPRISEQLTEWTITHTVLGTYVRSGSIFVELILQFHDNKDQTKSMGFAQDES